MRKRRIAPNGFTYMGVLKALSHMRDGLSAVQVCAVFNWFARWKSYILYFFDFKSICLFIYFVYLRLSIYVFFLSVLLSLIFSFFLSTLLSFFDKWYHYFYLSNLISLALACLTFSPTFLFFLHPLCFFSFSSHFPTFYFSTRLLEKWGRKELYQTRNIMRWQCSRASRAINVDWLKVFSLCKYEIRDSTFLPNTG